MSAVYARVSNRGTVDLRSARTKLSFCRRARKTSSLFVGIGCRVCLLVFNFSSGSSTLPFGTAVLSRLGQTRLGNDLPTYTCQIGQTVCSLAGGSRSHKMLFGYCRRRQLTTMDEDRFSFCRRPFQGQHYWCSLCSASFFGAGPGVAISGFIVERLLSTADCNFTSSFGSDGVNSADFGFGLRSKPALLSQTDLEAQNGLTNRLSKSLKRCEMSSKSQKAS